MPNYEWSSEKFIRVYRYQGGVKDPVPTWLKIGLIESVDENPINGYHAAHTLNNLYLIPPESYKHIFE